jgi:hypothetical protein
MPGPQNVTESTLIRVKMLGKFKPGSDGQGWLKHFPGRMPRWQNVEFSFDRNCRQYDWLVVYDDLPSVSGERHPLWTEPLACPPDNTLLITVEPSSIKTYGNRYLKQFRWVLTTQERWATGEHNGIIQQQPALIWFYASSEPRGDFDTVRSHVPLAKAADLSTVCSSKRQGHTLHRKRFDFTQSLKRRLPALDIYGHGVRPLVDKADALDPYRYHVAIENHLGAHHWTEKLADAFLGACLPFYAGCPNAEDYFPADSFVRIDLDDLDGSVAMIEQAIRDNLWEQRLPAILEARRRVLDEYGTFATVSRLVNERHRPEVAMPDHAIELKSRRQLHRQFWPGLTYLGQKSLTRLRHRLAGR